MKKYLAIVVCVIMLLGAFTACTDSPATDETATDADSAADTSSDTTESTDKPDASTSEDSEPVELLVWSEPIAEFDWEAAFAAYKADTGSTTEFTIVSYPYAGLTEAGLVAIQSDTFPDIYFGSGNRIVPYINMGVMAELPEGTVDPTVWPEQAFEFGNVRDTQYYVAARANVFPLVINKALFKKAGVEDLIPDEETRSWTREDFEAAIKAIGALGDDTYGISFDLVWNDTDKGNDGFIWADSDAWTDETYETATFNTPSSVERFEWIVGIMQSEYTFPNPLSVDYAPQTEAFYEGKIGIMCEYAGTLVNAYPRYEDGTMTKDDCDPYYVFFPTDDGSPSKMLVTSDALALKMNR